MIEDEQILLQNLSSDLLDSYTYVNNETQYKHKDDHHEQSQIHEKNIITEKSNQRKYYVDWNQADNHQYFTKNIVEDIQDSSTIENAKVEHNFKSLHKSSHQINYNDLNSKLELALSLIKSSNRNKEIKYKEKRSQSNEPRKQREMKCLTKTGLAFKGSQAKERKQSMNYRVKTQSEEESFIQRQNPFQQTKMDKYQTHYIIAEEKEHASIKENYKQNTLRNKFLDSIALWQEKKEKRIQQRIQKEMKLSMQGVTFTPEINAKSRQIMKKKGAITPIYEREFRQKKRELTQRFNVDQKNNRTKF